MKKTANKTQDTEQSQKGKVLSGVVTSTKMTDTAVVEVKRYQKHPKYGKFINARKKYKIHDAGNTAKVGDKVTIIETKPISKDKKFRLLEITSAATVVDLSEITNESIEDTVADLTEDKE